MKIGIKGLNLIKSFEGCSFTAYKCPAGIWTIGYGHTKGVKEGMRISSDQADKYLLEDLTDAESAVNSHKLYVNQNQYDALVSFTFNLGAGNLSKSTLLRLAKTNPNDPAIRVEFMKWDKAKGKVLKGLTRRRKAEADLYFE